jgi:NDP-sugar pyrophosphorylase family protein
VATPKQAMLLAAGRGTRLGELGRRTAKALVEVGGEPLLARQLRYLAGQGVERLVVNASHLADQVQAFAAAHPGPPEIEVVVEDEPLGTAGGVRNALPRLGEGPLLVLYGDVIAEAALAPMGELHAREEPVATLAAYHSDSAAQKGVLDIEGTRVTGFHEKDPARTSGWVNAGVYIVETAWIAEFTDPDPLDFGYDLFPAALRSGRPLCAYELPAPVLDIGTPEDLARARGGG